jgi:3-isopropylmalate/(R)-2-methylmalate dehydratase small subunit
MQKFRQLTGTAAPLMRANVDTEVIIRMDRLIKYAKGELGPYAFESWRYLEGGEDDPSFPLNQPKYKGAPILVAGTNFGCGSSREMAVWAMLDIGLRAVIAPSFGDIFEANCFQNGMLPIRLPDARVAEIAAEVEAAETPQISIDLEKNILVTPSGKSIEFTVDPDRRKALLEGLDDIAETLLFEDEIRAFRQDHRHKRPWIYCYD